MTPRNCTTIDVERITSFSDPQVTAISVLFIATSCLGVTLNLFTILAVVFGCHSSNKIKIFLINLSIVNFLFAALYPPYMRSYFLHLHFFSLEKQCIPFYFFTSSIMHACLWCRVVISIERTALIYFPFQAQRYNNYHKFLLIGIIWILSIIPEIPQSVHMNVLSKDGLIYCEPSFDMWTYCVLQTIKYFFPVSVVVISTLLMLLKLCSRKRDSIHHHSSKEDQRRMNKLLVMLSVDAFITIFTWLPCKVSHLYGALNGGGDVSEAKVDQDVILESVSMVNAFSTPIVYFIFNKNFRMDIRLLYMRLTCRLSKSSRGLNS
ncbi:galanin receptor 2b-like [Watersipora subatra]|uniref:galanin receptor 2b-like n=1 Tax=Watersipora subatra TaxID=2589382 RepID=UPI00355B489F